MANLSENPSGLRCYISSLGWLAIVQATRARCLNANNVTASTERAGSLGLICILLLRVPRALRISHLEFLNWRQTCSKVKSVKSDRGK